MYDTFIMSYHSNQETKAIRECFWEDVDMLTMIFVLSPDNNECVAIWNRCQKKSLIASINVLTKTLSSERYYILVCLWPKL